MSRPALLAGAVVALALVLAVVVAVVTVRRFLRDVEADVQRRREDWE